MPEPRRLAGPALAHALRDSRARSLAWTADLNDAQWRMPRQPGVNPVAWELAHLAWFARYWVLGGPPDALFDSARLAHAERWSAELPDRDALREMLNRQLADCIAAMPETEDDAALYHHRLALFHEDMHGEAFAWLRAALGYAAPAGLALARLPAPQQRIEVRGGTIRLGADPSSRGFAFDNERPGRTVTLADFDIDATPLGAGEFLRFVDADGYDEGGCWPGAAGEWRARSGLGHPQRWRRTSDGWQTRCFDRWLPLDPQEPLIHVNAFEAEAYCRWAGRRLPSAAQWEHAALVAGPAFHWGRSVWEWTADMFLPHPGFEPGPYRDYSAPWFGHHRELRGGAFATHARLHDARYRNFFMPHRHDVFTGFRTVSEGMT